MKATTPNTTASILNHLSSTNSLGGIVNDPGRNTLPHSSQGQRGELSLLGSRPQPLVSFLFSLIPLLKSVSHGNNFLIIKYHVGLVLWLSHCLQHKYPIWALAGIRLDFQSNSQLICLGKQRKIAFPIYP